MNKCVVFFDPDPAYNCLRIIMPAEHTTVEDMLKLVPEGCQKKVLDLEAVPKDRTFRSAWELGDTDD